MSDLQELVRSQRVPKRWPVGCDADTLFYVKVSDAEKMLAENRQLKDLCRSALASMEEWYEDFDFDAWATTWGSRHSADVLIEQLREAAK